MLQMPVLLTKKDDQTMTNEQTSGTEQQPSDDTKKGSEEGSK